MMNINLQFFAHKKGVGSTRNGRDSEAKRLGRTVCQSRQHPLQAAWNEDSSGRERWARRR